VSNVLDFGEVVLPNWKLELSSQQAVPFREVESEHGTRAAFLIHDINFARTWIRKHRYGETGEYSTYRIEAVWPNGETADWTFDQSVGWPLEDGKPRDWKSEWEKHYGGVA